MMSEDNKKDSTNKKSGWVKPTGYDWGESMYETEEEWEEYMKELERTRKALESKPCILETLFDLFKLLVVLGLFALIFLF